MGLLMKLKNGDTSLKSLKFGNDRPGGGDSGQPYVQTPIEGQAENTNIDGDGIIRGGLTAPSRALEDSTRLTKYLFSFKNPSGLLFTAKQNLLSRIAAKTETAYGPAYGGFSQSLTQGTTDVSFTKGNGFFNEGIYTPLSTIMQAQVGYLGQHLNKQGLDPTGAFENAAIRKYGDVAYENNKLENNAHLPKVPVAIIRKEDRLSRKETRKILQTNRQKQRVEDEFERLPTRIEDPIKKRSNPEALSGVNGFLARWDAYRDKRAIERLGRKERSEAFTSEQLQLTRENREAIENGEVVYDNRLLNLWDSKGLNRDNPRYGRPSILYSYGGGPNSSLGVGTTNIKFATLNDGVTPARTGVNRKDPYGPILIGEETVYKYGKPLDRPNNPIYSTQNIFNQGASLLFPSFSGENVSDIDLFGEENYLEIRDKSTDIQPWLSTSTLRQYGLDKPPVNYNLLNIFGNDDNPLSVSLNYLKLNPNTSKEVLFGEDKYIQIQNDTENIQPWTRNYVRGSGIVRDYSDNSLIALTFSQNEIDKKRINKTGEIQKDFRKELVRKDSQSFISRSPDYKTNNFQQRFNIGKTNDPGQKGDRRDYVRGKRETTIDGTPGKLLGAVDTLNTIPVYRSNKGDLSVTDKYKEVEDFCEFKFAILDTTSATSDKFYLHFRAYLEGFTDSYSAKYNTLNYLGRGEEFYKYGGYKRGIGFSFKVVALSKQELLPIYRKLNFLASSLAPSYTNAGYMGGTITEVTVGSYLFNQPGIIESMEVSIPEEAPWEIQISNNQDIVTQRKGKDVSDFRDPSTQVMPHMVEVNISFTPIHNFRVQSQTGNSSQIQTIDQLKKSLNGGPIVDKNKYGVERYINLLNKISDGYKNNEAPEDNTPIESQTLDQKNEISRFGIPEETIWPTPDAANPFGISSTTQPGYGVLTVDSPPTIDDALLGDQTGLAGTGDSGLTQFQSWIIN